MIESYLLEYLVAYNDNGTLSKAADELHISQPSMTRAMQKLEDILDVPLFNRGKNRLELNEYGKLAADYARRILASEESMLQGVRGFYKANNSFRIGSCAPGPSMRLQPIATSMFLDKTISSEQNDEDNLIRGLLNQDYDLVILSHMPEDKTIICKKMFTESLNVALTAMHPAASKSSVSFKEMDGQNFIMYAQVGVWEKIVRENMPHASFFKQEDLYALGTLAQNSDLPSFSTDITIDEIPSRKNGRINIPFKDKAATLTFYAAILKEKQGIYNSLLERL